MCIHYEQIRGELQRYIDQQKAEGKTQTVSALSFYGSSTYDNLCLIHITCTIIYQQTTTLCLRHIICV